MTTSLNNVMRLDTYLSEKGRLIDASLRIYLPSDDGLIHRAMRYSVLNGGKRLRPILVLAGCEAVAGDERAAIPTACALEFIHSYSLVHDDLPALDNDDLRRGKPTTHREFGEATAILAGDALLTLAFETIAETEAISPETLLGVIRRVSQAAGIGGMILGQAMDLAAEGREIPADGLEAMHQLKTGALIEASVVCGGMLGGGTPERLKSLSVYGKKIGLAFQIADDILDIQGSQVKIGKQVGSDLRKQKSTYPRLYGLEKSKELANQAVEEAVSSLEHFDNRADPLRFLARFVTGREE